jgi:hypothetical protein
MGATMKRSDKSRLRESGIPIDTTGPAGMFAMGNGPIPLIPEKDWPKEIAAMAAEESEFWKGQSISIQLMVELPFWIMIPDCDISVTYDSATVQTSIKGHYMAVSDGPLFFDSSANVIFIGPNNDLKAIQELPPVVASTSAPVLRPMKTVVIFRLKAMEDAVLALQEHDNVTEQELPKVRRNSRAVQYFQSLAYAHIPFLNKMITSYRITSCDPFAFQVSQWDVPVWFLNHNGKLVRISLMPYWDQDWYPASGRLTGGGMSPIYATSHDAVVTQVETDIVPGMLEILDARSLLYRGHLDDAVRSVVTAIEVALEARISKLLHDKGWAEQQIQDQLKKTWNNFDERLTDYERMSGTRVPGPILSPVPYINGIRLRSELHEVRNLRHRIVHEGLRVDSRSRGPMLRAIETMTWLFHWLSWEEGKAENKAKYYVFFEMMRGSHIPRYFASYCRSGVVVLPHNTDDQETRSADEIIWSQYLASIDAERADIELFSLMSFNYLGIRCEDAPPEPQDATVICARYHIRYNSHHAIVFCIEWNGLCNSTTIKALTSQLNRSERSQEDDWSVLCIINHQKQVATKRREVKKAISDDACHVASQYGLTLITALDLRFLVQGALELKWDVEQIRKLLFAPGRQGLTPPGYRKVGVYTHFYGRHSVMEVELCASETIKVGDTLGLRLAEQYHEEIVESLQVQHNMVPKATGPCRLGIKTTLHRSDLDIGQDVFIRTA